MASLTDHAHPAPAAQEHATLRAQRATWLGVLLLLCALAIGRLLLTAFAYGIPAWFDEELNPLIARVVRGEAITQIDARQYGVVVFLVFEPALRVLGPNLNLLASYAAVIALLAVGGAYALAARRFAAGNRTRMLLLAGIWASAVPLLYVVAQHMVDAWQLFFLSAALFFFTGSARQRRLAAVPLAFATLTKLLPALLLVYVLVRDRRAFVIGLACVLGLLAIGQVLYGPLMGFGYPLAVLGMGGDTVARWSTHFENNSLRGLLFKLAAGFRLRGDTTEYVLDPAWYAPLNLVAYALGVAFVAYLLWAAWRGRSDQSIGRRSIEFCLAIVTMLLVSPHTAQDYLITAMPVLAVWLYLASNRVPRPWTTGQVLLAAVSALLIGVFVPMNLAARVLPIGALLSVTDNAHNALFADQIGSAIGAYDFFGFPGLGLLLGWLLLLRLERQSAARRL